MEVIENKTIRKKRKMWTFDMAGLSELFNRNSQQIISVPYDKSFIDFISLGTYFSATDTYNISIQSEKNANPLKVPEFDILKIQDSKIYRFPKLALPRDKVSVITEKYNSRVIRDKDQCDLAVISNKYLTSIIEYTWTNPSFSGRAGLLAWLELGKLKSLLNESMFEFLNSKIHNLIGQDDLITVTTPYYHNQKCSSRLSDWLEEGKKGNILKNQENRYLYYIKEEMDADVDWLFNNTHKLVFDTVLAEVATEDSVPLTEDSYKQIEKMIKSGNIEDSGLGLEIMANCHIEKSKSFLSLLFYFNTDTMSRSKTWNHVNVKALRQNYEKYISSPNFHQAWAYDRLIENMVSDNCLTEFSVNVISTKMFKNVLANTFGISSNGVFEIDPSVLVLKEKYSKCLTKADIDEERDLPF